MNLWIFVFEMKFKNMILMLFLGPTWSPFLTLPKINFNVKTALFGSIQGLPMAASKTSVLGPSKIQICQKWFKIYDLKSIFLNFIWKTKIQNFIGNSQWNKTFLHNKIIIYIIQILNNIENSFKKPHMKSLRFALTKRIWKAIFIEETRRNVLRLCKNFGLLRWKWIYKVFFLRRNAHSWLFTKQKTSRFFQAELRPFGAQRNHGLTQNFAWLGSIQGLEINAQNRRGGVHLLSCGAAQAGGFWAL